MPRKTRARVGDPLVDEKASMRPRPDAAENGPLTIDHDHGGRASMRPRPDAAENTEGRADVDVRNDRFNEAAARCRGKRRPPPAMTPAEARFNEAAARCRGKRGRRHRRRPDGGRFNEAAARCRGKRRRASCIPRPRAPLQ